MHFWNFCCKYFKISCCELLNLNLVIFYVCFSSWLYWFLFVREDLGETELFFSLSCYLNMICMTLRQILEFVLFAIFFPYYRSVYVKMVVQSSQRNTCTCFSHVAFFFFFFLKKMKYENIRIAITIIYHWFYLLIYYKHKKRAESIFFAFMRRQVPKAGNT